jgi:adenine-specific DNA-methyltransferase
MALVDALLDRIADTSLRVALREQVDNMLHKQSFGLVFQQHKPETVELHNYEVRRGCKVRIQSEDDGVLYRVEAVKAPTATITSFEDTPRSWDIALDDLVVVREFGDAIYPGLKSIGRGDRGGDAPAHIVMNAENFHGLETLLYLYEERVDAIYIDPPYNSGARDWKYNNDYVDGVDQYRHSKWLAFMERRLSLAKRLLNPQASVLVVTIDEKEVHHLGMLLERMFPDSVQQMVTIVINAAGQARRQELARVDEYAFFIFVGDALPEPGRDDLLNERPSGNPDVIRWESLLRSGTNSRRVDRPQLFYPLFIDPDTRALVEVGEPKELTTPRSEWKTPKGSVAVWPLKSDGSEGNWRVQPSSLRLLFEAGHAKLGEYRSEAGRGTVWYLGRAARNRIESGEIEVVGHEESGAVIVRPITTGAAGRRTTVPKTVWNRPTHHSGWHGSALVRALLPGRDFPFPKSVYAVQDTLRVAVGGKKDALVLDFFAGSGTTAHALALLNAEDGGQRRSILITNNEVSPTEAVDLSAQGLKPGDSEWESRGIFHFITRPRVEAAITGSTPEGEDVRGTYVDGTEISSGLPANAEFFELTYEDPDLVHLGRSFEAIAPMLWLKAGGRGARIEKTADDWVLPDDAVYGVLFDTDKWREFVDAVIARGESVAHTS